MLCEGRGLGQSPGEVECIGMWAHTPLQSPDTSAEDWTSELHPGL